MKTKILTVTISSLLMVALSAPLMASRQPEEPGQVRRPAAVAKPSISAEERERRLEARREELAVLKLQQELLADQLETTKSTNKVILDSLVVLKDQTKALRLAYDYKGKDPALKQLSGLIKTNLDNVDRTVDRYSAFLKEKPLGNGKTYSGLLTAYIGNLTKFRQKYDALIEKELSEGWEIIE